MVIYDIDLRRVVIGGVIKNREVDSLQVKNAVDINLILYKETLKDCKTVVEEQNGVSLYVIQEKVYY